MKKVILLLGLILISCSKNEGQDKQTFSIVRYDTPDINSILKLKKQLIEKASTFME